MGRRFRGGRYVVPRGGQCSNCRCSIACALLTRYVYTPLSNTLSKDHEGFTNLLIGAPDSDKLATTVPSQTNQKGSQPRAGNVMGLFKALPLMTNDVGNKRVGKLEHTFVMRGLSIRRRQVPSLGDGQRSISGRACYPSRNTRGGHGRGFFY